MALVWKQRIGKIWYLTYAGHLGRRRRSLRTSNTAIAEAIRSKEENDILLGQFGIKQGPVEKIRLQAFAEMFLEFKRSDKAPSTVTAYECSLDALGEFLERDEWLHKITQRDIEAFKVHRFKQKKSPKTVRNDLINLKVAFDWARKNRFVYESPCDDVELPKRIKRLPVYLRTSDYLKLRKAIDDKIFRLIVDFYILTGCRQDEGCKIRPSEHLDLNAKHPVLHVPMSKTGTEKVIPIGPELLAVIKALLRHANGSDRLIPLHPDTLHHRFKKYAEKAELPEKLTFHSLRHTAGTWGAEAGMGLRHLQDFLGHGDAQSTQIYVHSVNEELRREIAKLKLPKARAKRQRHYHVKSSS